MSNQPSTALPTRIASLSVERVGQKLRIAGRLLSVDYDTQLLLVQDEQGHACLVNASLCIDPSRVQRELRDGKNIVSIVGDLERSPTELPIPILPSFVDAPIVDTHLFIQAILLVPIPELDLALWNEGIKMREEAGMLL